MDRNTPPPSLTTHRRGSARLRTDLRARLIDVRSSHDVGLENLSSTGARINIGDAAELRLGEAVMLQWAGFEQFGEIAWRDGERAGIVFDREVEDRELFETRHLQDRVLRDGSDRFHQREAARKWVHGAAD